MTYPGRTQIPKTAMHRFFALVTCQVLLLFSKSLTVATEVPPARPFATNGTLKMLYDNRMYPHAVELGRRVFFVWRGENGYPFVNSYDPATRSLGQAHMLLSGHDDSINRTRYKKDHHFAPVIWADADGHLHTLFGCHRTPGLHLVSTKPKDHSRWQLGTQIAPSISYPKVHHIYGGKTLIYYRDDGHLGFWQYRITGDHGETWEVRDQPLVDMNAPPQDGVMASHAGSYHTTRVSADGKTLHVAFIWKMENELPNKRYGRTLHDHTRRHNLYYLKLNLPSGKAYNFEGRELTLPVNKGQADRHCLVWDTQERVAAVGPSICLDQKGNPVMSLPVSEDTPHACTFYLVRRENNQWTKTPITKTSHPFNSSHLHHNADGSIQAWLITGQGESVAEDDMNSYGWGDGIEEWKSDITGKNWKRINDLTPKPNRRYQNIQFVSSAYGDIADDMLLFYGWTPTTKNGVGYFWQANTTNNFAKDQLVAWCIVPFDAKKRRPAERVEMLKRLGIKRVAYDWRAQHVKEFEEEILQYKKNDLEFFAFWSIHEEAFRLFEKHKIHPQIWRTAPSPLGETHEAKVAAAAQALLPLVERTKKMGSKLGLYNHGGWGGEPANLVAVCKYLRQHHDAKHVGIVYNLHHGHDHIANYEKSFKLMQPYLHCLNLNGMNNGAQPKILPLGQGQHETAMLKVILTSGYTGPVGILDHRSDTDTEVALQENLAGMKKILKKLGVKETLDSYSN